MPIFIFFSLLCLLSRIIDSELLEYCSKPLLMPTLFIYAYGQYTGEKWKGLNLLLSIALFFSCLGDIFLMIPETLLPLGFVLGLGSFLLAHLAYIALYVKDTQPTDKRSLLLRQPFWGIPPLGIALGFLYLAFPKLGELLLPVTVYVFVLVGMLLAAIYRGGRSNPKSFQYIVLGASLFLCSDLMIGINKFISSFPKANLFIMLTYLLAQYFIVHGYLHNRLSNIKTTKPTSL